MADWRLVELLPDGHRLFINDASYPTHAIADDSGDSPPETDDGTLLLDLGRFLSYECTERDQICSIPLRQPQLNGGAHTRTTSNPATLMRLSALLDWRIHITLGDLCTERLYEVQEIDPE